MGERFSVVEGELTAVEEVTGCGDHFIADDRKEVTNLDAQVTVGDFGVGLWQGMAVLCTVVPAIVPMVVEDPERLSIWSIGTIEVIDATAQSKAVATIGDLFSKEPLLAKLKTLWVGVEAHRVCVGMVSDAGPSANVEPCDWFAKEFPRIGQRTTGS